MLTTFSLLLIGAAVFYAALIGYFAVGFRRVRRAPQPGRTAAERVSVIVAARDEAAHIEACLASILASDYGDFEVIIVDDGSADDTAARVRQVAARHPAGAKLRLLQRRPGGDKRKALDHGIAQATGTLILTTDADCTVGPRWIHAMAACFSPGTGFVAGPVRYRPGPSLFGRFQALEFLALVATGAGGIGMNRPNMCNGANVAYRRAVYDRFARPEDPAPAPDEVLAQHLAKASAWHVRFCADADALVETTPMPTWRAFWAQRRRWAGTGPRYPRRSLVAAILGVYAFYVLLLAGLVAVPFWPALGPAVLGALALKIASEITLLWPACRHFGQPWLFRYYLPELPVQILYVVAVGLAAAVGRPAWKGKPVFR